MKTEITPRDKKNNPKLKSYMFMSVTNILEEIMQLIYNHE